MDGEAHPTTASTINAYLVDGPWVLLPNSDRNLFAQPEMMYGSKPTDGGHFFFTEEEKFALVNAEPDAAKFIHSFIGAHEYLNNEKRWVLWLVDANPREIKALSAVMQRVEAVQAFRLASKAASTRNYAYPTLFRQVTQPKSSYILIPGHTSENEEIHPLWLL